MKSTIQGTVKSETISKVLLFGLPRCPEVAAPDIQFQVMEYEALLAALCCTVSPVFGYRWFHVATGLSDAVLDDSDSRDDDTTRLGRFVRECRELGLRELLGVSDRMFALQNDGGLVQLQLGDDRKLFPIPSVVRLLPNRSYVAQFGIVPHWACHSAVALDELLRDDIADGDAIPSPPLRVAPLNDRIRECDIVAHRNDTTAKHVAAFAVRSDIAVNLFDLTRLVSEHCAEDEFDEALGRLKTRRRVFARPLFSVRLPKESLEESARRHAAVLRCLSARHEETLNPPAAGFSNVAKGLHLSELSALGLALPASLLTNDPEAAREFALAYAGRVVCKSGCGMRARVVALPTQIEDRLSLLPNCPVLFQELIEGPSCRVHFVRGDPVSVLVEAAELDYRFEKRTINFNDFNLPGRIIDELRLSSSALGLGLCGWDLRYSVRDDQWMVLEVNRMPAIEFYDHRSRNQVVRRMLAG